MTLSRRQAIAVAAGPIFFRDSSSAADANEISRRPTLEAWVDTLYPADELTPSASSLEVPMQIERKATTVHNYTELLKRGTAWADAEAAKAGSASFADLDVTNQEAIVGVAESMPETSVPGMFFLHTLRDGALFYYGNRETWEAVGFPHPPQPTGFPDFAGPPKA